MRSGGSTRRECPDESECLSLHRCRPPHGRIDRSQTDWYKDAIIYQLHIKAFQDANGDGIGDFAGLMQRLDYVQALGVTAIWLLPFYPSPLRDDGYDISDYRSINPSYGAMRDFKLFVQEAHKRGLRVITELVINTPPTSIPGSSGPGGRRRDRPRATGTSGAIPTRNSPKRGSSSSIRKSRTGPGIRWQAPITGTASIRTSPT